MKTLFIIILFPLFAFSQQVTTYDSRTNGNPVSSGFVAVDVADQNPKTNPDYSVRLRSFAAPALIDLSTWIGVTITGTVAQAEAELAAIKQLQIPAIEREKDKNVKSEAKNTASQAASANSVPALRDQVKRLAELVEQLQERVEMLEGRN